MKLSDASDFNHAPDAQCFYVPGVLLRGAADRSASSLPSSPRNHCAAGCSTSSGVALAGRRPMCALKWFGLAMQEQQRTAGARELSLE
ncbi:unnamed protein product [Heligmosomoides polygyrus]|uniref:Apple domain-containing protein n=1 Tax=Heligmosomoides polygyrus TaxID=6339 RepID=A0A183GNA1_HELPZ|nr:unnamed protein product [Heligmosomoides polygyrus]